MINAIVLMKIRNERINDVAQTLLDLKGVTEVYSVAGQYDLVVILRVSDEDGVAALVTDEMLKIEGVTSSETLIAFRTYSEYDLGRMFSIGMD
jgi:DNA-binding Lrp family transcriptional regulator